jgi:hypothetical protein
MRPARALTIVTLLVGAGCSTSDAPSPPAAADAAPPAMSSTGLPATCARGAKRTDKPTTCNGAAALCERTYDRVVVPMTHNAMSNRDEGWGVPNQTHGLARQLDDGIRGMMLDLHYANPETHNNATAHLPEWSTVDQVHLCHGACLLGSARLLDGLCTITRFLDEHPGEVLSIIFETKVTDADAAEVLEASGLATYAYTHTPGAPWPTLRALIDQDKRAVLFVETGGGAPPYLHPAFEGNVRDTPYTFAQVSDFTCRLNRGAQGDPLFLINHWLSRPVPDVAYAPEANARAVLGKRVADCTAEVGRAPTFVGVDFYDVGDLFDVVRTANGL